MAELDTVQKMVTAARELLQDEVPDYRYSDSDLLGALNRALLEARRLRFDLFLGKAAAVPSFSVVDTTAIDIDQQYRTPILYYIVGVVQLRDEEDTQDSRAGAFINKFESQMTAAI